MAGRDARGTAASWRPPPGDVQREAERLLLNRYAPPSVLVNAQFEIQQFRGRTSPFLEAPAGQPTTNILRMAREGLLMELRGALTEAKATLAPIVREELQAHDQGSSLPYTLRVLPVTAPGTDEPSFLVLFETTTHPWTPQVPIPTSSTTGGGDVEWLRRELASSKQYVQTVVDQHDLVAQDLRAAHEEVLSSNEELKSTNEELETTKEELQSANEELTTVNEQYQRRNRELSIATDDLTNFISSADLPMVTVGRDLCVRRLTPAAARAFNLLPSDVGRSIDHIKFSVAIDDIGLAIEKVMTTLQPWHKEARDRDGRWWLVRVQPYLTADNHIDGATIVAVDVDLIKRNEDLTEERDYARAILQSVREPLAVLDDECRVSLANEAFSALFRTTPEHVHGRSLWDSTPGVWLDAGLRGKLLAACRETQSISNQEIEVTLGDLGRRTLVLNATPIVRSDRPTRLLLAIEDVTNARAAETLRVDAETLRQVDRRKDEFLGILAHELRNPLAPMRFALELLRRSGELPDKTDRHLQVIDRQVAHMVRIIDDLLDVSRITQGKLELRKESVPLTSIVHGAIEICRPAIEAAQHDVKVSLPTDTVMLRADPVRLTQILVNVLNNAVKFTPRGGHLYVIAETVGEDPERLDQVRIRIRDNGIGIAPELLPKIFDMFAQGDRSLERTRGGLGVGLTLVRSLAHLHGGSVEVRSDGINTGTEVILYLPTEPPALPASAEVDTTSSLARTAALRILVADDNEDGRDMLRYFLESEGHTVETAADGISAVQVFGQFRPEVVLLDIGMPGLSGYTVAEQIRAHPHQPLRLIALSGLGQEEDKRRAVEAGFDIHFTKPVDIPTLNKLLASIAGTRSSPPGKKKD